MMALRILSLQNMSFSSEEQSMHDDISEFAPVPADDINRSLTVARVDSPALPHIGLVGDTPIRSPSLGRRQMIASA